jgi:hypothetical protein
MVKRITLLLVLLFAASIAFSANYKAVLKTNGKVIEGTYIRESDTIIYVQVEGGIQIQLKKDQLDLDKMKELNGEIQQVQSKKSDSTFNRETKTIARGSVTKPDTRSFSEIAKDTAKHRTGTSRSFKEGDRPCSKIAWVGESGLKKLIEDIEYEIADKEFRGGSEEELNDLNNILALVKQEDDKGAWAGEEPSKEVSIIFLQLLVAQDRWRLAVAQNYGEQDDIDDARDILKEHQDELLTLQSEVTSLNSSQQPCPEEKKETFHTIPQDKNSTTAKGKLDRAASQANSKRTGTAKVYTEADTQKYTELPEGFMDWWEKLSQNDREMWIRRSEDNIQVQENLVARYQSDSAPQVLIEKEVKKLEEYKAELRRMKEHLDAPYEPYVPPEPQE